MKAKYPNLTFNKPKLQKPKMYKDYKAEDLAKGNTVPEDFKLVYGEVVRLEKDHFKQKHGK